MEHVTIHLQQVFPSEALVECTAQPTSSYFLSCTEWPYKCTHLGVRDYFARYGDGIRKVLADMGPTPTFEEAPVLERMEKFLNHSMPLDSLTAMRGERERNLAHLASLKKKLD